MIHLNKKLLLILVVLIPLTIISFNKKETNFIMAENNNINVVYNSEVINMPLEEYVIGVVAAEMPALFEVEALKAQAITARSYALATLKEKENIEATINDQVYISKEEMKEKWKDNYLKYLNKITNAVEETSNLVIKHNDEIIKTYYFSKSNGYTANSETVFNIKKEYLDVIESIDKNNYYEITMSKEQFCSNLKLNCQKITITNELRDNSNRVKEITINNTIYKGTKLRKLLNLRSTDFKIEVNDIVKITTNGYGHGVGMSQYGANMLAKEGYNYMDILNYYYKNIEIEEI